MIFSRDEKKLIFVTVIFFFFFVHSMCLSGSQFPDEGLNLGHGSESSESPPLDPEGTPKKKLLMFSPLSVANITDFLCVNTLGSRDLMLAHIPHCGLWYILVCTTGPFESSRNELYCAFLLAQMIKNLPAMQESWVLSLHWEDPLEEEWHPTTLFLPKKFHGQRTLVGYSPRHCEDLDMTE